MSALLLIATEQRTSRHVSDGSKPDFRSRSDHVRLAPDNGLKAVVSARLLRAKTRLMHRNKAINYSITLSARTRNDSWMFKPIAFAVFRFTANSNLTDMTLRRESRL